MGKIFLANNYTDYATWLDDIEIVDSIEDADLVIFEGGADVTPALYDEVPHATTNSDTARDLREISIFESATRLNKSILSICRGAQFCTVMNGGKLIQNVSNHAMWGTHKIELNNGKVIAITSTHHQMMYPFNLNPKEYQIIATSYPKRSDYYQTGFGEYMNEDIPVEPEIVFYPKTKCLCVQGHPEMMSSNSEAVIEVKRLIEELL